MERLKNTALNVQSKLKWDGQQQKSLIKTVRHINLFKDLVLEFRKKAFNTICVIEVRCAAHFGEDLRKDARLFMHSLMIEDIIKEFNADPKYVGQSSIFLDDMNPPFVVSIATAMYNDKREELGANDNDAWQWVWTPEFITQQTTLIGKWSDFYVGGFPNYSKELWDSRITFNLTNRLSELQYIRTNSALIYMPMKEWEKHYKYMEEFFIGQIFQVKALHMAFILLNKELDSVHNLLMVIAKDDISSVSEAIEKVQHFDDVMSALTSELYSKRLMNRRPHAKKVLDTLFTLLDIDRVRDFTDTQTARVKARVTEANNVAIKVQSDKQKDSLNLMNYLLGLEVVVSVCAPIFEYFGGAESVMKMFYGEAEPSLLARFGFLFFGFMVALMLSVVGKNTWEHMQKQVFLKETRRKRIRALHRVRALAKWRLFEKNLGLRIKEQSSVDDAVTTHTVKPPPPPAPPHEASISGIGEQPLWGSMRLQSNTAKKPVAAPRRKPKLTPREDEEGGILSKILMPGFVKSAIKFAKLARGVHEQASSRDIDYPPSDQPAAPIPASLWWLQSRTETKPGATAPHSPGPAPQNPGPAPAGPAPATSSDAAPANAPAPASASPQPAAPATPPPTVSISAPGTVVASASAPVVASAPVASAPAPAPAHAPSAALHAVVSELAVDAGGRGGVVRSPSSPFPNSAVAAAVPVHVAGSERVRERDWSPRDEEDFRRSRERAGGRDADVEAIGDDRERARERERREHERRERERDRERRERERRRSRSSGGSRGSERYSAPEGAEFADADAARRFLEERNRGQTVDGDMGSAEAARRFLERSRHERDAERAREREQWSGAHHDSPMVRSELNGRVVASPSDGSRVVYAGEMDVLRIGRMHHVPVGVPRLDLAGVVVGSPGGPMPAMRMRGVSADSIAVVGGTGGEYRPLPAARDNRTVS